MSPPSETNPVEREPMARISELEQRLARLECNSSTKTLLSRLAAILRTVALLPLIALPLLFLLQLLAEHGDMPFGVACLAAWACTVVLWLILELFTANSFRFSLARLLVATALFCVILGFGQSYVLSPLALQQRTLGSINGLTTSVHREPHGPTWMRWLLSDRYFERVVQLEVKGPDGGDAEIPKLENLPHLRCVFLTGPGFTDDGLHGITALPETATVYFTDTRVTRKGVERIRAIRPKMKLELQ